MDSIFAETQHLPLNRLALRKRCSSPSSTSRIWPPAASTPSYQSGRCAVSPIAVWPTPKCSMPFSRRRSAYISRRRGWTRMTSSSHWHACSLVGPPQGCAHVEALAPTPTYASIPLLAGDEAQCYCVLERPVSRQGNEWSCHPRVAPPASGMWHAAVELSKNERMRADASRAHPCPRSFFCGTLSLITKPSASVVQLPCPHVCRLASCLSKAAC